MSLLVILAVVGVAVLLLRSKTRRLITANVPRSVSWKMPSLPNFQTLVAAIFFVVAMLLVWIWREIFIDFPTMTYLQQTTVVGTVLSVAIGGWGLFRLVTKSDGPWPELFATAFIAAALIVGLLVSLFGERLVADPNSQQAFDLRTGEPQYMGYYDSGGVWHRGYGEDGELLHPSECRPKGVVHEGFNYSTDGSCFAPSGNGRMVPITPDNVPVTPNLRPFSTPEERAAKTKLATDTKAIQRAAAEALQLDRQRQLEESRERRSTIVTFGPCNDPDLAGPDVGWCGLTSFERGQKVVFNSKGHCPKTTQKHLLAPPIPTGDGNASFTALASGTAKFWTQKPGTTVLGVPCGSQAT